MYGGVWGGVDGLLGVLDGGVYLCGGVLAG